MFTRGLNMQLTLGHLPRTTRHTPCNRMTTYWTQRMFNSTASPRPVLRIMPLGGSVTHGVGSSDGNGYRKTLLELLHGCGLQARMVGSRKTGTMSNNEHEGWRGYRIDQIEAKARLSAEKLAPHIFAVNAGSNDCLQDYNVADAPGRLDRLLEHLWAASPGSTVVVSSLLVNKDEAVNVRVRAFNEQVEVIAQRKDRDGKKIIFVDMHDNTGPLVEDLVEDGTHPSDKGFMKMAKIWLRGIQEASNREFFEQRAH